MDIETLPATLVAEIEAAWPAAEKTEFNAGHGSCDYFARGYVAARAEKTLETRPGAVVTFDDQPYDAELDGPTTTRLVATCVPGSVDPDGVFSLLFWTDPWGRSSTSRTSGSATRSSSRSQPRM